MPYEVYGTLGLRLADSQAFWVYEAFWGLSGLWSRVERVRGRLGLGCMVFSVSGIAGTVDGWMSKCVSVYVL